jgi:hypothetical protein
VRLDDNEIGFRHRERMLQLVRRVSWVGRYITASCTDGSQGDNWMPDLLIRVFIDIPENVLYSCALTLFIECK